MMMDEAIIVTRVRFGYGGCLDFLEIGNTGLLLFILGENPMTL